MSTLLRLLKWTYVNDLVEPFPEIVLFLSVVVIASNNFISSTAATDMFTTLTWKLVLLIIILVAIGGTRSFSFALEKREIVYQLLGLRVSRWRFAALKWLSLLIVFFSIVVVVDVVAFVEFLGYFPPIAEYSLWGSSPAFIFAFMVGEQLLLLAFLNSLVMLISIGSRKTTSSLLIFLVVTLFSALPYLFISSGFPDYLMLGYGDYQILNPASLASLFGPNEEFYFAVLYRAGGAIVMFVVSLRLFKRMEIGQ